MAQGLIYKTESKLFHEVVVGFTFDSHSRKNFLKKRRIRVEIFSQFRKQAWCEIWLAKVI
jgi:hypothetical protein